MPRSRARRTNTAKLISLATAVAALVTGTAIAVADSGGVGGTVDVPVVTDVACIEECAGLRKVAPGSRIEITGRKLSLVNMVSFPQEQGPRIQVEPSKVKKRKVIVRVPRGAITGKPRVHDVYGAKVPTPYPITVLDGIPLMEGFKLQETEATPRNAFYDSKRTPKVVYRFKGEPTDVLIDVVHRGSGAAVRTIRQPKAEPQARHVARWDGLKGNGKPAPQGRYRFVVRSAQRGLEGASKAGFALRSHMFPVRGRHSYGDGFGSGRNHQGVDIFARCGTPLVAARGGRVKYRQYHAAAGHYVVIDGRGTNLDYMYAHLRRRSPLRKGQRVRTGDRIGVVGETGNASGCHLHFEIWKGPWQMGGSPLPRVKRIARTWDRWS